MNGGDLATFAILTKTYAGDRDGFARLATSIDRFAPDVMHYVLIDARDRDVFQPFVRAGRSIVTGDALLAGLHPFTLGKRRLWWSWPSVVVRGWIQQQLAKIAFVATCKEDAIVIVDSDTTFVRPLRRDHVFAGDTPRLFRKPGQGTGPRHQKWHRVAREMLGLAKGDYTGADYITQGVIWSPRTVRAMIDRIETITGRSWLRALAGKFEFSEYILYGVFCDFVADDHLFRPTEDEMCHCSWHYDLTVDSDLDKFVGDLSDAQCAVLLQSNLHLPRPREAEILDRLERRAADQPQA